MDSASSAGWPAEPGSASASPFRAQSERTASIAEDEPPAEAEDWLGKTFDGFRVTAELKCQETGETWWRREDVQFGRKHYYNPITQVREDAKRKNWKVVRDPNANEVESAMSVSEDEAEDDAGETFVSATNGKKYTKYYDERMEEYYYVEEETNETTWEHPDGEGVELLHGVAPGAFAKGSLITQHFRAEEEAKEAPLTSEERSDMMVSKILLVDEKWLEKQPPLVAVPKRPEDFEGVYGEKEKFWDPDGDTYSIDNNEGSERGEDVHIDVYELVDELERYTSAVDYATPNDLRPLSVAKQYLDGILSSVYEMMEEDSDFSKAEQKVRRASAGTRPAPVIGKVFKTITCDLDEGPKVMHVMHSEAQRAKLVQRYSEARLRFEQGDNMIERSLFYQRLYVSMAGTVRSNVRLISLDSGHTPLKDTRNLPGYHGSTWELNRDDALSRSGNLESVRDDGEGGVDGAPKSSNAASTPKKKMGWFGKFVNPDKAAARAAARDEKRKAKIEKKAARIEARNRKELEKAGFVAPWEADENRRADADADASSQPPSTRLVDTSSRKNDV
jgi:hypothetical protein